MTGPEMGFLLLASHLGNPNRHVLTTAQIRILSQRVRMREKNTDERKLEQQDIVDLGFGRDLAKSVVQLLEEEELLRYYLRKGVEAQCLPLTLVTSGYPKELQTKLGDESPSCLWCKGDISLLTQPKVALVGSRELLKRNREFAREVGFQAAKQGYVLVSGNARGADTAAQEACLEAGGSVISVVADRLTDKEVRKHVLYLSENDFDADFSAQRAISRNRVIHALGQCAFVAQSDLESGGTWDGTTKNLRGGWSPVCCFADSSPAINALIDMGAQSVRIEELANLSNFFWQEASLF